jgi:arylsulfatase A-like enzyme
MRRLMIVVATVAVAAGAHWLQRAAVPARSVLVIVIDGLRPDAVTPDVMPRLSRLARRGMVFSAHHSVFPTVTRVNAASFVTGAYPETHGIVGNSMYVPSVDAARTLDTGSRKDLEAIGRADRRLLTAPSLGEILEKSGRTLLGVSAGSSGSAFLLNHAAMGGGLIHTDAIQPPALAERLLSKLGPPPPSAIPNDAQDGRAVDAYLAAVDDVRPDVTLMWLNDPDATAHRYGIGADVTKHALSLVDAQIGRVEDGLAARALLASTDILVVSDHGFSTHTGELKLADLVAPFARALPGGGRDIVVAEGAIHVKGSDADRVTAIVRALQQRPEVGAIFTRPRPGGGPEGVVPGTLSFDVARWRHRRSGDILVSAHWTADVNAAGVAGTTTQAGVAGHGTSSPYDIHNTLIAAGPDFRQRATSEVPTSNVDIAPTILRLLHLDAPATMTGRVIEEAWRDGPPPASLRVDRFAETAATSTGTYAVTAHVSRVGGHRYLDFTEVQRR